MADDPLDKGGYRPPPPGQLPPRPEVSNARPIDVLVPRTARDVDPNIERHNETSRRKARADYRHGGEDFLRAILQHGKFVTWRKAMLCPCITDATGQADLNCAFCDGSGYTYVDPIDIQANMMMFEKNTRLYEKFGLWAAGEVSVTVEPEYRIGWRDSLEMRHSLMNFNELIRKDNRRGRRSVLPPHEDVARYRIVAVSKALYRDPQGNVVPLEKEYHFTLTDDGHLKWLAAGDKLLPPGSYVSLHYDFHPVWIVISHPHVLRDDLRGTKVPKEQVIPLPVSCAAQLDFLTDSEKPLPVTGTV